MHFLLARLARSLPLVVALLVAALVIYAIAAWRTSPSRAKAILIRLFTVLTAGVCIFFLMAALYAALDSNPVAVELALTFMLPGVIGLVITLIARSVFLRHHPAYRKAPMRTTYVQDRPWARILQWMVGR